MKYPKVVTRHPIVFVTREYPTLIFVSGLVANTVSGVRRVEFIAISTPFETFHLINQVKEGEVEVA